MPADRRLVPRALAAAVAVGALSLTAAGPAPARPGGHGPARPCVGCAADRRMADGVQTSSLAGTSEAHPGIVPAAPPVRIAAPDDARGATTLAVLAIAGGALLAGGGAGFAGGRRVALRVR